MKGTAMNALTSHLATHQNFVAWLNAAEMTAQISSVISLPVELLTVARDSSQDLLTELSRHVEDPNYSWDGSEPEDAQRECEAVMIETVSSFVAAVVADIAERENPVVGFDIDAFLAELDREADENSEREPEDNDYL